MSSLDLIGIIQKAQNNSDLIRLFDVYCQSPYFGDLKAFFSALIEFDSAYMEYIQR